jgi:hypothetical protein
VPLQAVLGLRPGTPFEPQISDLFAAGTYAYMYVYIRIYVYSYGFRFSWLYDPQISDLFLAAGVHRAAMPELEAPDVC